MESTLMTAASWLIYFFFFCWQAESCCCDVSVSCFLINVLELTSHTFWPRKLLNFDKLSVGYVVDFLPQSFKSHLSQYTMVLTGFLTVFCVRWTWTRRALWTKLLASLNQRRRTSARALQRCTGRKNVAQHVSSNTSGSIPVGREAGREDECLW